MRKLLLLLLLTTVSITAHAYKIQNQDTNFGSAAPEASAKLQVDSTTKGFLPPRMTEAQRDLISVDTDSAGLLIYNTDVNQYNLYSGSAWGLIGATGTLTPDAIQYTIPYAPGAHSEGLSWYDDTNKTLAIYNDVADVTWQLGREVLKRTVNNTGSAIGDCTVVYISGDDSGVREISKANAGSALTATSTIGVTTSACGAALGTACEVTQLGEVNDCNTNGFASGTQLWLDTTDGVYTTTMPTSPNYAVQIGTVGESDPLVGSIDVRVNVGSNWNDIPKFWNGATLEQTAVTVTTAAEVGGDCTAAGEADPCVKANFGKQGGGNVNIFFNGGFTLYTASSVVLDAGSDASPTLNYVYILESTNLLTANTTGWPATQHSAVATVMVQSIADVTAEGAFKVHAWSDHLSNGNDMGHVSHQNRWIRSQPATWDSGMVTTPARTAQGAALDNIDVAVSAGSMLQLHPHDSPAYDTAVASKIHVLNFRDGVTTPASTIAYTEITDLNEIIYDASSELGASLLVNNRRWSVVLWQVVSETTSESKIFANAPTCTYVSDTGVIADTNKCSVYTIPPEYKGTAILLARISLQYTTPASGTLTIVDTEDLRDSGAVGGGSAASTAFPDNVFSLFDEGDASKIAKFEASGISADTTQTFTFPDLSGNLLLGDALTYSQHSIPFINGSGLLDEDNTNFTFNDSTDTLAVANLTVSGSPVVPPSEQALLTNVGLASSVATSALTIALKTDDGSTDASGGDPVIIGFRSSTVTSGSYNLRSVTGALSIVVPSGATLGTRDATEQRLWIYAIDNAGTVELAISGIQRLGENVVTTVALSAASDSISEIYSTTLRSNVPARLIGYCDSTQTTAGTWASNCSSLFAGQVVEEEVIYFHASTDAEQSIAGNPTVVYGDVQQDSHGTYNASTGFFTAPTDGFYTFTAAVGATINITTSQALEVLFYKNTSTFLHTEETVGLGLSRFYRPDLTVDLYLSKDDTIRTTVNSPVAGTLVADGTHNFFSAKRVSK